MTNEMRRNDEIERLYLSLTRREYPKTDQGYEKAKRELLYSDENLFKRAWGFYEYKADMKELLEEEERTNRNWRYSILAIAMVTIAVVLLIELFKI